MANAWETLLVRPLVELLPGARAPAPAVAELRSPGCDGGVLHGLWLRTEDWQGPALVRAEGTGTASCRSQRLGRHCGCMFPISVSHFLQPRALMGCGQGSAGP